MRSRVAVTVRAIAAGGSGIADLPDGRVVFVPRTAPGDRVSVEIERSKKRWATASVCEVVEPSAERRAPLCALYDVCGGCQLQHLTYPSQLEWKARFVHDALVRIGGLESLDVPTVVASPREVAYRNRVTLTLRRLPGGRVVAGFHELHHPARVVDVRAECMLPRPALLGAWLAVRAAWGEGAKLLPAGGRLRITLREEEGSGVALVVEGGEDGWSAKAIAGAVPAVTSWWHWPGGTVGGPRLMAGTAGAGATAFAQVNPEVAAQLVEHVIGLAGGAVGTAVDAYCGIGAYARVLAERGWSVTGIEMDPSACEAARASGANVVVLEGRAEDLLGHALPADLLIVNPPRSGLPQEVVHTIVDRGAARIIYVSCDPATLARDVAALSARYEPTSLQCFDLFPQTAHVETVLELRPRRG